MMISKENYMEKYCDKVKCAICKKDYFRKRKGKNRRSPYSLRASTSITCSRKCSRDLNILNQQKHNKAKKKNLV